MAELLQNTAADSSAGPANSHGLALVLHEELRAQGVAAQLGAVFLDPTLDPLSCVRWDRSDGPAPSAGATRHLLVLTADPSTGEPCVLDSRGVLARASAELYCYDRLAGSAASGDHGALALAEVSRSWVLALAEHPRWGEPELAAAWRQSAQVLRRRNRWPWA